MGTKRSIHSVGNNSEENLPVPPGFVSLTSLTLKRRINADTNIGTEVKAESITAPFSNLDMEKFKASLKQRPWMPRNEFVRLPQKNVFEQTKIEMKHHLRPCLPKGVIRGCDNCNDCIKVTASWHPENSCLPELEDAPVFHPTKEEFRDTLTYIAKIRPEAEKFGICRIVPPPSWRPPCLFQDQKIWKESKFRTHVQKIDGLKYYYLKRRLSRFHEKMETKNPEEVEDIKEYQCIDDSPIFEYGIDFTLQSFKKYADDFKNQYFVKTHKVVDPDMGLVLERHNPLIARIEGEYWRIIEKPSEEIEVLYGKNSESRTLGSGFPIRESSANMAKYSEYVESGWNLNNIPKLSGSLLPFGCYDTSTVLVPQLFIGMCFASQAWRSEDHHLYSLSYMHLGNSKVWYGIPQRYCFKFMEVVKKLYPQLSKHPELLHKLVTQISPSVLKAKGIPVYRCVQSPYEFVVTFPGAYHSEFSCGFNISETVCFAPFDWLPHGQNIVELYSENCWKTSISHDKLLIQAAMEGVRAQWKSLAGKNMSDNNQLWKSVCGKDGILTKALKARVEHEEIKRKHLCNSSSSTTLLNEFDSTTKGECNICRYDLYLSGVTCSCSPNKYSCPLHTKQLCTTCSWRARKTFFRYEITELNFLVEALEGNLRAVHSWAKKVEEPVAGSSSVLKEGTATKKVAPAFNGNCGENESTKRNFPSADSNTDSKVGIVSSSCRRKVDLPPFKDIIILLSDGDDD